MLWCWGRDVRSSTVLSDNVGTPKHQENTRFFNWIFCMWPTNTRCLHWAKQTQKDINIHHSTFIIFVITETHVTKHIKYYNLVSHIFFKYNRWYCAYVHQKPSTPTILFQNSLFYFHGRLFWYLEPTRYVALWILGFWITIYSLDIILWHLIYHRMQLIDNFKRII